MQMALRRSSARSSRMQLPTSSIVPQNNFVVVTSVPDQSSLGAAVRWAETLCWLCLGRRKMHGNPRMRSRPRLLSSMSNLPFLLPFCSDRRKRSSCTAMSVIRRTRMYSQRRRRFTAGKARCHPVSFSDQPLPNCASQQLRAGKEPPHDSSTFHRAGYPQWHMLSTSVAGKELRHGR